MPTRAAILIESSNVQGQRDLPGARLDVANWQRHLRSMHGGAWRESEITVLHKPGWATLKTILTKHADTNYVFITFSGHGDHLQGKDIDETRICLNENDDVLVTSVNPGNPRCTFVVDSCRGIVREEEIPRKAEAVVLMEKQARDVGAYRQLFEAAVEQAERGTIRLYSCDLGESAGESSRSGGYFSTYLVDCSEAWYRGTEQGKRYYYPVSRACDCAAKETTKREPQQHPQYEGGRRTNHFPLAVCP